MDHDVAMQCFDANKPMRDVRRECHRKMSQKMYVSIFLSTKIRCANDKDVYINANETWHGRHGHKHWHVHAQKEVEEHTVDETHPHHHWHHHKFGFFRIIKQAFGNSGKKSAFFALKTKK